MPALVHISFIYSDNRRKNRNGRRKLFLQTVQTNYGAVSSTVQKSNEGREQKSIMVGCHIKKNTPSESTIAPGTRFLGAMYIKLLFYSMDSVMVTSPWLSRSVISAAESST